MPIDVVQWRARIGLFHSEGTYREMKRRCGCEHQKIKIRSLVGDSSFVVAVALLGRLEHIRTSTRIVLQLQWKFLCHTSRCGYSNGKPSLPRKSISRANPGLIADLPSLSAVCLVTLHSVVRMLLIMSGDVEQNPGPLNKIILNVGDLPTLTNILEGTASKWMAIGNQLGVAYDELRTIQSNPRCIVVGDQGCFQELLAKWLKWAPPKHELPTLEKLALALRSAGEERLAYDLPQKYREKKENLTQASTSTSSIFLRNPGASPEDSIEATTKRNVAVMRIRFTDLLDYTAEKLQQKLEKKEFSIKTFHLTLAGMFAPAECIPMCSDMHEIFLAITKNQLWSHFNYYQLETIIEKYCKDNKEMTQKIAEYKQALAGFKVTTKEALQQRLMESELRTREQESRKLQGVQKLEVETKESENEELTKNLKSQEQLTQSLTDQLEREKKERKSLREELSATQKELSAVKVEHKVQKATNESLQQQLVQLEWRAQEAERESHQAKQESQQTQQQLQRVQGERDELIKDKRLDWERKELEEYKMSASRLQSAVAKQEKELEHLREEKIQLQQRIHDARVCSGDSTGEEERMMALRSHSPSTPVASIESAVKPGLGQQRGSSSSLSDADSRVLEALTLQLRAFCLTAEKLKPGISASVKPAFPSSPAFYPTYPTLLDDYSVIALPGPRDKPEDETPSASVSPHTLIPEATQLITALQRNMSSLEVLARNPGAGGSSNALVKIARPHEYGAGDVVLFHPMMTRSKSFAPILMHLEKPKPYFLLDLSSYSDFGIRPGKMPDLFLAQLTEKPRSFRFEDDVTMARELEETTGVFYRVKAKPAAVNFAPPHPTSRPPPVLRSPSGHTFPHRLGRGVSSKNGKGYI